MLHEYGRPATSAFVVLKAICKNPATNEAGTEVERCILQCAKELNIAKPIVASADFLMRKRLIGGLLPENADAFVFLPGMFHLSWNMLGTLAELFEGVGLRPGRRSLVWMPWLLFS